MEGLEFSKLTPVLAKETWESPPDSVVKINFDAAFQQLQARARFGVVVRNSMGEVIGVSQKLHDDVDSTFATEGLACLQAEEMGAHLGSLNVIIKGDAKFVLLKC